MPRNDDSTLESSLGEIEIGNEHLLGIPRSEQSLARGGEDAARADEAEAVFFTDPVARGEEDSVLGGPYRSNQGRGDARLAGPVRRQGDQIGAVEGEDPAGFWLPEIEADQNSDAADAGVEDREGVTTRDEAVESEPGQMRLPIQTALAVVEDSGRVVEGARGRLSESDDEDHPEALASHREPIQTLVVGRDGDSTGVFQGRDAVSGEESLRKHRNLDALIRQPFDRLNGVGGVGARVVEDHVGLDARDSHRAEFGRPINLRTAGYSHSWMSVTPGIAKDFLREVEAADRIYIGTHLNPDGDAIGSALAVALFLDALGRPNEVLCNDLPSYNLRFLPSVDRVRLAPEGPASLAILVDLDSSSRLGKIRPFVETCPRMIVIDHHVPHEAPGDLRIVDTASPATAAILYDLFKASLAEITPDIATCLLAGIITDTGSFRFSNTTPHSLTISADLLARGGNIVRIGEEVFQKKQLPAVRLLGRCIAKMKLALGDRLAWSALSHRDFEESGATEEHTEGLANELLSVDTVQVAALIREPLPGKVRASLRSRGDFDVASVARQFGGGGHKNAAGCTFDTSLEEAERALVSALESCLASS